MHTFEETEIIIKSNEAYESYEEVKTIGSNQS